MPRLARAAALLALIAPCAAWGAIARVTGFPVAAKSANSTATTYDAGDGATTLPQITAGSVLVAVVIGSSSSNNGAPVSLAWISTPSGCSTWTKSAESRWSSGAYMNSGWANIYTASCSSLVSAGSQVRATLTGSGAFDNTIWVDALTGASATVGNKCETTGADSAVVTASCTVSSVTDGSWVYVTALTLDGTYTVVSGTTQDDKAERTNADFNGDMYLGHHIASGAGNKQVGWTGTNATYKMTTALEIKASSTVDGSATLTAASATAAAGTVSSTGTSNGTSTLTAATSTAAAGNVSSSGSGANGTSTLTAAAATGAAGSVSSAGTGNGSATLTAVAATAAAGRVTAGRFPLSVSSDGHYLVGADGAPFQIRGDAPWDLLMVSSTDAVTYLDARQAQGFNAVLVELFEHRNWGNLPNVPKTCAMHSTCSNGPLPFTTKVGGGSYTANTDTADLTSYNTAFFDAVDVTLDAAAQRGMLVILSPFYLGYSAHTRTTQSATNEGWSAEAHANSESACSTFGTFLGNRYASRQNILWSWVSDDDLTASSAQETCSKAVMAAMRTAGATQPYTAHLNRTQNSRDSTGASSTGTWQVNAAYTKPTFASGTPFTQGRAAYANGPAFVLEDYYEGENSTTRSTLRYAAWGSLLSTTGGFVFGNSPVWFSGSGWLSNLSTTGATDTASAFTAADVYEWHTMVPTTALCTAGCGTEAGNDYVPQAISTTAASATLYIPPSHTGSVTVDLSKFSGPVAAYWRDPVSGAMTAIGTYAASGTQAFTPSGANSVSANDWALLLDPVVIATLTGVSATAAAGSVSSVAGSVATLTAATSTAAAGSVSSVGTASSALTAIAATAAAGTVTGSGASAGEATLTAVEATAAAGVVSSTGAGVASITAAAATAAVGVVSSVGSAVATLSAAAATAAVGVVSSSALTLQEQVNALQARIEVLEALMRQTGGTLRRGGTLR